MRSKKAAAVGDHRPILTDRAADPFDVKLPALLPFNFSLEWEEHESLSSFWITKSATLFTTSVILSSSSPSLLTGFLGAGCVQTYGCTLHYEIPVS